MKLFVLNRLPQERATNFTEFFPDDTSPTGPPPQCPVCGSNLGMLPLISPVSGEIETWGMGYGDMAFGPGDEIFLTAKFWLLYEEEKFSGLSKIDRITVKKIIKHQKFSLPIPDYVCCQVCRSNAAVDEKRSGIVREQPPDCKHCRQG